MNKKNLGKASENAVNKFFSQSENIALNTPENEQTNNINIEADTKRNNITSNTNITNNTKYTHITNKSKHYDERGKREARYGLLLDKKLKEDLVQICNAKGNRSMNDYIITLLIEHIERPENKKLLEEYRKLNKNEFFR